MKRRLIILVLESFSFFKARKEVGMQNSYVLKIEKETFLKKLQFRSISRPFDDVRFITVLFVASDEPLTYMVLHTNLSAISLCKPSLLIAEKLTKRMLVSAY